MTVWDGRHKVKGIQNGGRRNGEKERIWVQEEEEKAHLRIGQAASYSIKGTIELQVIVF